MKRIAIQLKISFIAAFMLAAGSIDAQTQTYTANGTFTVPAGVTSVQVEAWGGGGAGGGVDGVNWQNRAGGGGGGGAYVKKYFCCRYSWKCNFRYSGCRGFRSFCC